MNKKGWYGMVTLAVILLLFIIVGIGIYIQSNCMTEKYTEIICPSYNMTLKEVLREGIICYDKTNYNNYKFLYHEEIAFVTRECKVTK